MFHWPWNDGKINIEAYKTAELRKTTYGAAITPLSPTYILQVSVQIYRAVEKPRRGRGPNPLPLAHLPSALTHQATLAVGDLTTSNVTYRSRGEVSGSCAMSVGRFWINEWS